MGMNMVSKGVQNVLDFLVNDFPDMDVIGISGECYSPLTTFKILPIKESNSYSVSPGLWYLQIMPHSVLYMHPHTVL